MTTQHPDQRLIPGREYRIVFDDCCVQGEFTGTFTGYRNPGFADHSGDPDTDYDAAVFTTGKLAMGAWQAEELPMTTPLPDWDYAALYRAAWNAMDAIPFTPGPPPEPFQAAVQKLRKVLRASPGPGAST